MEALADRTSAYSSHHERTLFACTPSIFAACDGVTVALEASVAPVGVSVGICGRIGLRVGPQEARRPQM